jgi:TPR repeat protein
MEEIKQLTSELKKEESNKGNTCSRYYKEALKWFKLGADQANTTSQFNLGYMYENGIDQDCKEAIKLYKLSVDQGNAYTQNNLGLILIHEEGIEKDYKEAIKLYKLSADQGDSYAQYNLGYIYQCGKRFEKDYKEAIKWYKLSSDQGCKNARKNLKILCDRDILLSLFLADNMKIKELEKENEELKKENEALKYMAPIEDGPEYQKAKNRFDEKAKELKNNGSLDIED